MEARILSSDIKIEKLAESDISCLLDSFLCGHETLDRFFINDISKCVHSHYVSAYCVRHKTDDAVIAVFTLAHDAIILSNGKDADDFKEENYTIFPDEYVPIFKAQTSFPAINIAHLAVAKNYQDKGVGTNILSYIIDTFIDYDLAGCQIITVDSLNTPRVNSFYMRNGFRNFTDSDATAKTRRMYLLLEEFRNTENWYAA